MSSKPANAAYPGQTGCDKVEVSSNQDRNFYRGQFLNFACNDKAVYFQNDGNLVVYKYNYGIQKWEPKWATGTWDGELPDMRAARFSIQADGNVVLYNYSGKAIWATMTNGNQNVQVALQNDGNWVVYNRNGSPIWATMTNGGTYRTQTAARDMQKNNSVSANDSYLPFDSGVRLLVSQGNNSGYTHGGYVKGVSYAASKHALDFGTDGRINIGARAARAGKVLSANGGWNYGFGNLVKIQYRDGKVAYYAHLASMPVRAGEEVSGGQRIGTIGNTGNSEATHLHYEERDKGFNGTSQPLSFKEGNVFNRGDRVTSTNPDGRR